MTNGRAGVRVRVFPDGAALSAAAAQSVASLARQGAEERGNFSIALSGGSTPKQLYSLLGSPSYRDAVPWDRVHVFWADERCVAPYHEESNYRLAAENFLSRVPLPAGNIHRIRGEEGPGRAARAYEEDLRAFFGGLPAFSLVLLGVGEDGHTASLFPGLPEIDEKERLAMPVYLNRPKYDRVTLTLLALNHADHVVFLVAGRTKAGIVSVVLEGDGQRRPAGLVRPVAGDVTWMLDKEAAGALRESVGSR